VAGVEKAIPTQSVEDDGTERVLEYICVWICMQPEETTAPLLYNVVFIYNWLDFTGVRNTEENVNGGLPVYVL
jgi:hypothetical protein